MTGNEKALFEIQVLDQRTGRYRPLEQIAVECLWSQEETRKLVADWIATTGDAYDEARHCIRVRDAIAAEAAYV